MERDITRAALWSAMSSLSHFEASAYRAWAARRAVQPEASFTPHAPHAPSLSLIVTDDDIDARLQASLGSIAAQDVVNLEVSVVCQAYRAEAVGRQVAGLLRDGVAVSTVVRPSGMSTTAGEQQAVDRATGDFVGFVGAGDLLAPRALQSLRAALVSSPAASIVYGDEDWIDDSGARLRPRFKTDWDPEAQLGFDLIGRLALLRRSAIDAAGGLDESRAPAAHYDLHCRLSHAQGRSRIVHVPSILYHRRTPDDFDFAGPTHPIESYGASARQSAADLAGRQAGEPVAVEASPLAPFVNRVRWPLPDAVPLVSVLIPTRDQAALLEQAVRGVLAETDYPRLEVVVLDNGSVEPETSAAFARLSLDSRFRVLPMPGPFNYARLNNDGVAACRGDIVVFMNNDIKVLGPAWLRDMVALAVRPDIGAVGAKLLYADRRIQHAGVLVMSGPLTMHPFRLEPATALGNDGQLAGVRSYLAVTAACLAIRRDVFLEAGGFDAEHLRVAYNDADLCFKVADLGYHNVCTPYSPLLHLESASRGLNDSPIKATSDRRELDRFATRWADRFAHDPFRNPNLRFDWNGGCALVDPDVYEESLLSGSQRR